MTCRCRFRCGSPPRERPSVSPFWCSPSWRGRAGAPCPPLVLLRLPLGRALAHPLALAVLRIVSVALFVALIAAGLFGNQDSYRNLALAFVWIVWWVGFAYLSALVGDLWAL